MSEKSCGILDDKFQLSQRKGTFPVAASAGLILLLLFAFSVPVVPLVYAQSGNWEVTIQSGFNCSVTESGASVTITMSGSSTLHFTVANQQVSGSGQGHYSLSLSGSSNIGGASATISAPQLNIEETDSVTGTVQSDMTVELQVTTTSTNAPTSITGTMRMEVQGQIITTPIDIPVDSMTQTTSGTYEIKLQDGYRATVPISTGGVEGETSISVARTSSIPTPTGSHETTTRPPISTAPPTIASQTPTPTSSFSWGTVGLLRGSAAIMDPNTGEDIPLTGSSEVSSGSILTTSGGDSLVQYSFPSGNGYVDFGPNSQAQFIGIQQETTSNGAVTLTATVPPLPNTYTGPYEEGLIDEGLGPLGFLIGGGEALFVRNLRPVVVEGILYLLEGTAHFFEGHSTNENTHKVEPIALRAGYIIPAGTEYTVSVSNDGTTIDVISGPLVFLDWKTGNTVQVESGQSLTLPNVVQSGFSSQDLQNDVSTLDSSSVNHWWADSNVNPAPPFPWLIIFAFVGLVAVIAVLAVVLVWKRRRKTSTQQLQVPPPPPPPPPF